MARFGMCIIATALCAVMGCGGGGSIAIGDLLDQDANTLCDRYVRCGVYTSHDVCVAQFEHLIQDGQLLADVANGTVAYDGSKAADCLDAADSASCDPSQADSRKQPASCSDAVKGTVADGGVCKDDTQCISGSCTMPGTCTTACCAGTCDPTPPAAVAIGQACEVAPCVDGAYCSNGTCAALIAAGQSCTSSSTCDYGLVCAGATASTCVKAPAVGDACLMTSTTTTTCVSLGLVCDATSHCIKLLGSGAACDPQRPMCAADLVCDATSQKCAALPAVGQACTSQCAPGGYCKVDQTAGTGTCTALGANGTACTSSGQCDSDHCDTTTSMCADPMVCT